MEPEKYRLEPTIVNGEKTRKLAETILKPELFLFWGDSEFNEVVRIIKTIKIVPEEMKDSNTSE